MSGLDPKTLEKIQENVRLRKEAQDIIGLVEGEKPAHFWRALAEEALSKLPAKKEVEYSDPHEPMTEEQAALFERQMFTKGKQFLGEEIGDVPCWYILYFTEPDPFVNKLIRYSKSARFKRRQEEEPQNREDDDEN